MIFFPLIVWWCLYTREDSQFYNPWQNKEYSRREKRKVKREREREYRRAMEALMQKYKRLMHVRRIQVPPLGLCSQLHDLGVIDR
mmetsp:Transcript_29711/g.50572  ORF Transcript_29711/g.50572 Transcript_29711/m.50572 type:complete len:85 (+) Transcript_29711:818-1072(+)